MNKFSKISFFLFWIGIGTFSATAQKNNVGVIVSDTIATKTLSGSENANKNPFNLVSGFMTRENYTPETNTSSGRDENGFIRPEVFVEKAKPKLARIDTKFNPNNKLSALPVNHDIIGYWEKKDKVGLDFNQIAFVNWSAGGDNSISGILKGDFNRKYIKGRLIWDNKLNVRYGVNKQSERELRKTDDVLEINSTFGYKSSLVSDWYYVSKLNFKTQFTNGFNYPNTENPVSSFFAPAYLFVGVGGEYFSHPTGMKYYISPITYKATFVMNQILANQGAFGVDPAVYDLDGNLLKKGKNTRAEVGLLLSSEWKREVFTNMFIETKLTLYTDYINHFGNVNVLWDLKLDMKVNDFVQASIGMNLVYDDNIKTKVQRDGVQVLEGPRVQLKQSVGVGLVYLF